MALDRLCRQAFELGLYNCIETPTGRRALVPKGETTRVENHPLTLGPALVQHGIQGF